MTIRNIELYPPDIQTIPYFNYQKFQKYLILSSGLGSDTNAVVNRVANLQTLAAEERFEDIQIESGNLVLAIYSVIEGLSYESMAFACMVKSIDGKVFNIASDEAVRELSSTVVATGITQAEVQEYIDLLKKKIDSQLNHAFKPNEANIDYLEAVHFHTLLQLKLALDPEPDTEAQVKAAYNKILDLSKPKILDTRLQGNIITQMDKDYQKTMLSFKENNIQGGENFTIFDFYTTCEYYAEKTAAHKAEMDKMKKK